MSEAVILPLLMTYGFDAGMSSIPTFVVDIEYDINCAGGICI
jgi:hypothetical protein